MRTSATRGARSLACALALSCGLAMGGALAAGDPAATLTAEQLQRVLSLGPWPPAAACDPTSWLSCDPQAIELGRRLFFDKGLSRDGRLACASCHDPARGFTDGRPRAQGLAAHDRNTQGLLDVADRRWFGWDGGADSLWAAAIRPLLSPTEMGADAALVARRLRADPALRADLALGASPVLGAGPALGAGPGLAAERGLAPGSTTEDERLLVRAGKALAAWMETLRSPRTPFDDFRDALARGDAPAAARYPAAALRGLKIFVGKGNCWMCHLGPGFTNDEFHDVGMPFLAAPGRVDPGRHAGLRRLRSDPYNLLGRWVDRRSGDGGGGDPALKTRTVRQEHRNWGEWRTPTLRGLSATAPYMHDGRLASLRDVLRHYSELDEDRLHVDGEAILRPLRLSEAETDDLLAFLHSLEAGPARQAATGDRAFPATSGPERSGKSPERPRTRRW
ncbi:cytochrome-c peroxidase [Quisquiliibacterium transsilvanicum]|uniref:Cytochrome c peroxidase n=1 Tax=Quisquiliibacterium transsilvanicum TaxID=1549638 RepID=A0A7W8HHX6_9BURK|nr:cytochrome c peroxidase [Quisquiliibacterium transsilvanicum]MBB5272182.1 cytochrome c peroxidase [Quisquiliibacterium transsilvanicum]